MIVLVMALFGSVCMNGWNDFDVEPFVSGRYVSLKIGWIEYFEFSWILLVVEG